MAFGERGEHEGVGRTVEGGQLRLLDHSGEFHRDAELLPLRFEALAQRSRASEDCGGPRFEVTRGCDDRGEVLLGREAAHVEDPWPAGTAPRGRRSEEAHVYPVRNELDTRGQACRALPQVLRG